MLSLLILLGSLSYSSGAGIVNHLQLGRIHNRLPIYHPGYGVTTMMPMTTTTAPPASMPISDEDDFFAAEIGVRLPPKECVISYDQFVEHVVEMDWHSPYSIDNDYPINKGVAFKFSVVFSLVNSTHIRRRGSLWDDFEMRCLFADGEFVRVDNEKAIFASAGGNLFATSGRVDYFVSFDPSRYVIFYICYDTNKSIRGRCPNSEILLLLKDQRETQIGDDGIRRGDIILNDIHWTLIEETFKNCLGQQFVDETEPQISWVWDKDDCPKPLTRQFEEGTMM
ncbi:uncharacterized protein LOC132755573 [Ruditapes philippinarum]|uniref:uncharacterized protein LOC132755573 n=1 Tax=Ruditapes philippinarum TaxID=129788 RepID=UPI00295A8E4A|nr:uncharacterized protein LOC132755573 [Ruditapes philippinarum]